MTRVKKQPKITNKRAIVSPALDCFISGLRERVGILEDEIYCFTDSLNAITASFNVDCEKANNRIVDLCKTLKLLEDKIENLEKQAKRNGKKSSPKPRKEKK